MREHSLRKFFKTRLISCGVPESHVDYMMGHVTNTYNDIKSLGIERLRQEYAAAAVRIKSTTTSPDQAVEELVKIVTENPSLFREFMGRLTDIATTNNNSRKLS